VSGPVSSDGQAVPSATLLARRNQVLADLGASAEAQQGDHRGRILPWDVDGDEVRLHTELTGVATFTETFRILTPDGRPLTPDPDDPTVAGALDLLALTTSVSYLKATLPAQVEFAGRPVGPAARAMLTGLLSDGLAELALRNGLGRLDGSITLVDGAAGTGTDAGMDPHEHARDGATRRVRPGTLVTVGGGKDSALTLALAVRNDPDTLAVAINPRAPMERTTAWAGVGLMRVERRLDRQLLDLNARGAINGHVPITAIVTSAAVLAAAVIGRGTVLVSNERSADAATRVIDGWSVNHQYSKSADFQRLLDAALAESGTATQVVSFLRPLSELAIARGVAGHPGLIANVTSCNAAYALDGPGDGWCGRCDKCRFVQLALAPFVDREELHAALGFDALGDPDQVEGFAAMLDEDLKPFECVGTVEEVRLALDLLAADPAWRDAAAVADLATPTERVDQAGRTGRSDRAARSADRDRLDRRLSAVLRRDPSEHLPAPFDSWLANFADAFDATDVTSETSEASETREGRR
jgi:7-cyano-7-deazaguanine synthase in queuosine biosynthesis